MQTLIQMGWWPTRNGASGLAPSTDKRVSPTFARKRKSPSDYQVKGALEQFFVVSQFAIDVPTTQLVQRDASCFKVCLGHHRRLRSFDVHNMCHVLRIVEDGRRGTALRVCTGFDNGCDEIHRCERIMRRSRLAIDRAIQNQDLRLDVRICDYLSDILQDQGWNDGRKQRADAVHYCGRFSKRIDDSRICRHSDLLAIWIDIPQSRYSRRQIVLAYDLG